VSDPAKFDDLDAMTAHELRERGSLKWTKFDAGTIGAFVAEMDFGTAPPVVAALQAAVAGASFGYLPPGPRAELAAACAQWQRRYGWRVAAEQVYPVSDVLTAFELTLRHLARPGKGAAGRGGAALGADRALVILPTPAYMPFLTVPPLLGREIIEVPMARDGERYVLDLDGLDRAYRAGGHLLVLCNPANPVGRVLTAAELAGVAEVVDRHGGRVFADEIHAPLVYPGHQHVPYASTSPVAAGHTVTALSASKAWDLPGLKCGQVILSNPDDVETWERVSAVGSPAPSVLGVAASIAAYRSGEPWLDELVGYLDRNRRALAELLAEHLPEVGYDPPEGTYLAWLDCRELGIDEGAPAEFFHREAGVAAVDGAECGEAGRGQLRLNFATPLPILRRAVTRMGHAYHQRG
jgi:cystathionine beta-lyase